MPETLDALRQLQDVELQLGELRRGIESRKRQIKAMERRVQEATTGFEAKREEARTLQRKSDAIELEIRSREAEIVKLREALNRAKANKEYAALLTQINTDKADNAKFEEQGLQALAQADAVMKQAEELRAQRDRDEARRMELVEALKAYERENEGRMAELTRLRNELAQRLPAKIYDTFRRAAEKHDGEALVQAEQQNVRLEDFSCGGCFMSITLEQVNAMRNRGEIATCHSCGRLLWMQA